MSAVEPVLQVYLCLPDKVVAAQEVPVEHGHGQDGVLGKGGLELEALAKDLGKEDKKY